MHQRTVATLNELESVEWFSHVGTCDSARAKFVDNWEKATQSCSGEKWRGICEEAVNQYRSRLFERNMARFRNWNDLVCEVKKSVFPLVAKKTKAVVDKNDLPEGFVHAVQWDILGVCMEAEYADIFPPGFFAAQAFWYSKGHFPCGWDGDFPHGRPMVF